MTGVETTLSVIATMISSIALIGVAAGLILQSRQLHANRLQVEREIHLEIIKLAIENPALDASIYEREYAEADIPKASYINLLMHNWQTSYALRTVNDEAVALEARYLFKSEFARKWWKQSGFFFDAEAGTRNEKKFYQIVDATFRSVEQSLQAAIPPVDLSNQEE